MNKSKGNMNKGGIEFSFNWLFSILVGAVIIFLAVYGASKFVGIERGKIDTESAQRLEYIINPLETSIESFAKPREIIFPILSRIIVTCDVSANKGASILRVQSSSEVGGTWQDSGNENLIREKYLFAQKINEGKRFYSLILPFNFPYKVGQLVMIWSKEYCFVSPPSEVEEVFGENLTESVKIVESKSACNPSSVKVCFDSVEQCDISVDMNNGRVKKDGKSVFFMGDLIYPAIFSDNEVYECNLKRLNEKKSNLAKLYSEKSLVISSQSGCSSALQAPLMQYASMAYLNSRDLSSVYSSAKELERMNKPLSCKLWKEEMNI
ncbi:MAG: hypothetical protein AABX11_00230 [Nanoarchaeota archaeon]